MAKLEIRELTKEEVEILEKLKEIFNLKTRTKVVKHLINLAKKKYL